MIIGLSAKAKSGKDTLADYLVQNYGYIKVAFADELKTMCSVDFDLSKKQLYGNLKEIKDYRYNKTPREILQATGQFYRSIDIDFWVNKCITKLSVNKNYVISDVRLSNEYTAIKKLNGKIIRINRDSVLRGHVSNSNDISETDLDNHSFDLTIENNGTLVDLYNKIDNWGMNAFKNPPQSPQRL